MLRPPNARVTRHSVEVLKALFDVLEAGAEAEAGLGGFAALELVLEDLEDIEAEGDCAR